MIWISTKVYAPKDVVETFDFGLIEGRRTNRALHHRDGSTPVCDLLGLLGTYAAEARYAIRVRRVDTMDVSFEDTIPVLEQLVAEALGLA